jgi:NAD(P)H-dependent FMN reductase
MSGDVNIIVFAGSARHESLARRVAAAAVAPLQAAGATVYHLELADFAAPLYNGDDEVAKGLPPAIIRLQQLLCSADGLLIASPEYNGSISPLLKNTLDWCSRSNAQDPVRSGLACFQGKAAALLGSSPGALGGLRALFHVRDILGYLFMQVIPQQLAIGKAHEAFNPDGSLKDARQAQTLADVCTALVTTARRLKT